MIDDQITSQGERVPVSDKRIPVAILGATGNVGQRFIQLLERLGLAWNVRTPEGLSGRRAALTEVSA